MRSIHISKLLQGKFKQHNEEIICALVEDTNRRFIASGGGVNYDVVAEEAWKKFEESGRAIPYGQLYEEAQKRFEASGANRLGLTTGEIQKATGIHHSTVFKRLVGEKKGHSRGIGLLSLRYVDVKGKMTYRGREYNRYGLTPKGALLALFVAKDWRMAVRSDDSPDGSSVLCVLSEMLNGGVEEEIVRKFVERIVSFLRTGMVNLDNVNPDLLQILLPWLFRQQLHDLYIHGSPAEVFDRIHEALKEYALNPQTVLSSDLKDYPTVAAETEGFVSLGYKKDARTEAFLRLFKYIDFG